MWHHAGQTKIELATLLTAKEGPEKPIDFQS